MTLRLHGIRVLTTGGGNFYLIWNPNQIRGELLHIGYDYGTWFCGGVAELLRRRYSYAAQIAGAHGYRR